VDAAAARNYPPGDLRVSDADRDRVVSELGEHFQSGRITAEELDERSGLALRARTGSDLTALLADLPVSQGPWSGVAPVPGPSDSLLPRSAAPPAPRRAPWAIAAVACAVLAVIAVAGLLNTGHSHQGIWIGPVPIIIAVLIVRRMAAGGGWGRRL
jgi:Domain of unknown function (DUF1707)